MKGILTAMLFLAATYHATYGQISNSGKEFWVGYGHNQFFEAGYDNGQEMVLYLSAEQAATVTVSINGTSWTRTYTVAANTVIATEYMPKNGINDCRLYTVPPSFGGTGSEGVFTRGIHIESNVPIVAYAHIFGSHSSGATMLMPVETWGFSYVSLNFSQYFNSVCFSWLHVIASHDNTKIQITTTTPTRGGHSANETFDVVLNKGQVYQLLGAGTSNPVGSGYDITGTTIKVIPNNAGECYRIAAFSGSSRTQMSMGNCTPLGGDCYIQQIFPSQAWGKHYLTAPTSVSQFANGFMPNYYRIVVTDPATEVKVNGAILTGLINNRYYSYASSTADYITANKPVMVAQYMPSTGCNASVIGDEEMIYISPLEQAIKHVAFYRNTKENIEVNYLTLIIPTAGVPSLRIDGSALFDYTYLHPNLAGYTVVVKRWTAAQKQVTVASDSAFTAITYGLGGTESYGYNAGTLINNLNGSGEIRNVYSTQTSPSSYTCRNTPFIPSLLIAYKPTLLRWAFSEAGNILPATDVMEVMPEPVDSQQTGDTWLYRYRLPQSYMYKDIGIQQIPVYSTYPAIENCNHTEIIVIPVKVNAGAPADFTYSNSLSAQVFTGCRLDTLYMKPVTQATRYRWTFSADAADTSLLESPKKIYATAGSYQVRMQGIMADGCVDDTTKTIQVYPPPQAGFSIAPLAACEQSSLTVTNKAAYNGSAPIQSMYWNLGDGRISNTTASTFALTYPTAGTYKVQQVAKVSALCISDTVNTTITIYAKPVAAFTYSQGCLGADGIAQFTNTTTLADNQSMTYQWNFGDPASGTANSATVKDPSHQYQAYSEYPVSLQVTTAKGCMHDTTIKAAFALRPALAYDAIARVCENSKGSFAVANARVTNGVPGKGKYRGPGTDEEGHFNPATAGAGTHTIWYVFQTTGDCKDSVSQTVTVDPVPVSSFRAGSNRFCADAGTDITIQSSISSGMIQNWYWNFGNGQQVVKQNSNPFTLAYTAGNYTIKHAAVSDQGCTSDTAFATIAVNPVPLANFTTPAAVCMPAGKAQFVNRSVVAGNEALSYTWSFGDGGPTVADINPLHVYRAAGDYTVRLQVSTAAGCRHDTTKMLSQFYDQPIAAFTVTPQEVCEGGKHVFTDASKGVNSSISAWKWNFGDGSTTVITNPEKRYSQPGSYKVSLVVTSAQGCLSDSAFTTVIMYPQPLVEAGPSFVVAEGTRINFAATVNDPGARLTWTPGSALSNDDILTPSLVVTHDGTYTLTATGAGNCTASDTLSVRVVRPVVIPNVFTPNGDGINDTWAITNLADYPSLTIQVFGRYGNRVWYNTGYAIPWDGTYQQKPLAAGTYYYIIDLKNGEKPLSGSVTIIR